MTYPQLSTGALSHFPIRKRRVARTIVNQTPDGRTVKIPDVAAQTIEWQLNYAALTDAELSTLEQFFVQAQGSLNGFTLLDPCGNLLAWSDDISQPEWQKEPFLTLTGAVTDPAGGQSGWHIANAGSAGQSISQTLNAPGAYVYCLSVFLRSAQACTASLSLGSTTAAIEVGQAWSRFQLTGAGNPTDNSICIGLEVPADAAIDVFGPQLEPQIAPSVYQRSTTGGVYEGARFRDDVFRYTSTDVNRHSTVVNILYGNHF